MIHVRGCHRSIFLRAPSAIGLLGKPMPFDGLPDWRLIPNAPTLLDSGLDIANMNCQVGTVEGHYRHLQSEEKRFLEG